jgi:hypothetical protein
LIWNELFIFIFIDIYIAKKKICCCCCCWNRNRHHNTELRTERHINNISKTNLNKHRCPRRVIRPCHITRIYSQYVLECKVLHFTVFFLQKRNVHYENAVNTYSFNPTYPLFDF